MTTNHELTNAQLRNLEIIRAHGGNLIRKNFAWLVPGSTNRIKGLNGNALRSLERAGLIRESYVDGVPTIEVVS